LAPTGGKKKTQKTGGQWEKKVRNPGTRKRNGDGKCKTKCQPRKKKKKRQNKKKKKTTHVNGTKSFANKP